MAKTPAICDIEEQLTFAQLQQKVIQEALLDGDILIIARRNKKTTYPQIQLIPSDSLRTPIRSNRKYLKPGHRLRQGVEMNARGKHIAFWVQQADGKIERIPAYNRKTGELQAWLFSLTETRNKEIRAEPFFLLFAQALRDLNKYRTAAVIKSGINASLPTYIKKTRPELGKKPISNLAIRQISLSGYGDSQKSDRFKRLELQPGMIVEELQPGEEPVFVGGAGTDINYGEFEDTITKANAYTSWIPPEIFEMKFTNSFSASQAAIIELMFNMEDVRGKISDKFCSRIWEPYIISATNNGLLNTPG